jgi:hypothetical protein
VLGAELEAFGGNKIVMGVLAVLAALAGYLVFISFTAAAKDNAFRIFTLTLFAIPAFLLIWVKSVQVTLHSDGISYKSMFGEKEVRWDAVEKFYYSATKRSINFIPIGTFYTFKFVDNEGGKLRLGNRAERLAVLGQKLIELTYPTLIKKAVEQYNTGQEVDFGSIRVTRATGIKVKKFIGWKEIPWNEVSSYAIQKGHFYVWRKGEKRTTGPGLDFVPNAFALQGLLKSILNPSAS